MELTPVSQGVICYHFEPDNVFIHIKYPSINSQIRTRLKNIPIYPMTQPCVYVPVSRVYREAAGRYRGDAGV